MKTNQTVFSTFRAACVAAVFSLLFAALPARAGLTVDIHLYHDSSGYVFYPYLSTNTTPPDYPIGTYLVASWQHPTNGTSFHYLATSNSFDWGDGNGNYYTDNHYANFDALLYGMTNGLWTIDVTNSTATNHYKFNVSVTGLTSNGFGAPVVVSFPTNNALKVTNQPTFTWTGPANWADQLYVEDRWISNGTYYVQAYDYPSPNETSWPCPVVLSNGDHELFISYYSNATSLITASTPTNDAGQPISGWISTSAMQTFSYTDFQVYQPQYPFDLTLVGRFDFEDTNSPGIDSSGNANNANCGTGNGGTNIDSFSTNSAVGNYARQYNGDTAICFAEPPYANNAYYNLSNAFYGSFSLCAWVKTAASVNDYFANAYFGAPIWFVYNSNTNHANFSITGGKVAFTIGNSSGDDTTMHSTTSVNDGDYHFIVATRNSTNGVMKIYVDGHLEATDLSTNGPVVITGGITLAGGWYTNFPGLLDDVRIYSSELSADAVAILAGLTPTNTAARPIAHFDFDNDQGAFPLDVTGNGNDMNFVFGFNNGGLVHTNITIAGPGSLHFFKDSGDSNSGGGTGWSLTPAPVMAALADTFSISVWVKTTIESGFWGDPAYDGACIVAADDPTSDYDLTPIALTEGSVAFTTGGDDGDDTMTSDAYISDDQWHHIVVTRDRATGDKRMFIDGVEDINSPQTGSTNLLDAPKFATIGVRLDASAASAGVATIYSWTGYEGLLDDFQIYPRVLNAAEVEYLFDHPGEEAATVTNTPSGPDTNSISIHLDVERKPDLSCFFDVCNGYQP